MRGNRTSKLQKGRREYTDRRGEIQQIRQELKQVVSENKNETREGSMEDKVKML